jgi:hypothetical protein
MLNSFDSGWRAALVVISLPAVGSALGSHESLGSDGGFNIYKFRLVPARLCTLK